MMPPPKTETLRLTRLADGSWECRSKRLARSIVRADTHAEAVERMLVLLEDYDRFTAHGEGVCTADCRWCREGRTKGLWK